MIKKLLNYKGYLLMESLFSLGLICFIINGYLSLNTFLLKKNKEMVMHQSMLRILYEETKDYENGNRIDTRKINRSDEEFIINFIKEQNEVVRVEIHGENHSFKIGKK